MSVNSDHESLHARLLRLYGEKTSRLVRRFDKLKQRKTKQLSTIAFLQRCRDKEVIPPSLKVKHHLESPAVDKIIKAASFKLLKENLHQLRKHLDFTSTELYRLHLKLSSVLNWYDFTIVDDISTISSDHVALSTKQKYCESFDKLYADQHLSKFAEACEPIPVINKSSKVLDDVTESVLSRGLNFVISPRKVPIEEIVCAVEASVKKLPKTQANIIRQLSVGILKRARKPDSNIPNRERKALLDLRSDKTLTVLAAYRENVAVVMDTEDYKQKVSQLLQSNAYELVPRSPISRTQNRINHLIKTSALPEADKTLLRKTDTRSPRLYALPNLSNGNVELIPKVGTLGSIFHLLSKYIAEKLKQYSYGTSALRSISNFLDVLKPIKLKEPFIMGTFELVSSYGCCPRKKTFSCIDKIISDNDFPDDFHSFIRECFKYFYAVFDGKFYEQKKGFALEDDVCLVLFNIFMSDFETKLLRKIPKRPEYWIRYNSTIFVVVTEKSELDKIIVLLNSRYDNLKFKMNIEENNAVKFMDLLIKKDSDGKFSFSFYDTEKTANILPNQSSYKAPSNKRGILKSLIKNHCAINDSRFVSTSKLRDVVISKGYSQTIFNRTLTEVIKNQNNFQPSRISNAIKKCHTFTTLPYIKGTTDRLCNILLKHKICAKYRYGLKISKCLETGKDSLQPLSLSGIYRIPCNCNKVYIGQTVRQMKTRRREHICDIRNKDEEEALGAHSSSCSSSINISDFSAICYETCESFLDTRESIEIAKLGPDKSINRNKGRVLHPYWIDFFSPPND